MTGKPYQIVIDTNILVAGLRSRRGAAYKLLTMLNDKRWQVNISTTLLMEYEEVLKRELENLFVLNEQDIDDFLDGICHIANHQDVFYIWRPMAHDPDDDFLIDLAVAAQADFLITYNPRDMRNIERFGIEMVSPKEFLQKMGVISK
ncbi:MAG: putative toxin-antitoxin system toxin component, PIN family [Desulfobacteraceae bacterium]|nr:putative toxin-antitoxin system toxin component, PIN family [Desulfobacteraceae bacterium]MCP4348993.1 putative toxin-antitoxin system toxin component, PIN family [Desulfobacterales bacterium]